MPIEKWQVYHLFCQHTKTTPKYKYVVIAYAENSQYIGFLINSVRVNNILCNLNTTTDGENSGFRAFSIRFFPNPM